MFLAKYAKTCTPENKVVNQRYNLCFSWNLTLNVVRVIILDDYASSFVGVRVDRSAIFLLLVGTPEPLTLVASVILQGGGHLLLLMLPWRFHKLRVFGVRLRIRGRMVSHWLYSKSIIVIYI